MNDTIAEIDPLSWLMGVAHDTDTDTDPEFYPDDRVIVERPDPSKRRATIKFFGRIIRRLDNPDGSINYYIQNLMDDHFEDGYNKDIMLLQDLHVATTGDLTRVKRGEVYTYMQDKERMFMDNWKAELAFLIKFGLATPTEFYVPNDAILSDRSTWAPEFLQQALNDNVIHGYDEHFVAYVVHDFDSAQRIRVEALLALRPIIRQLLAKAVEAAMSKQKPESQFHQLISGKLGASKAVKKTGIKGVTRYYGTGK